MHAKIYFNIYLCINRFLTKKLGNVPERVTDLALTLTLETFPVAIAVLIVGLALSTCGALGLAAGLLFYLIKVKIVQQLFTTLRFVIAIVQIQNLLDLDNMLIFIYSVIIKLLFLEQIFKGYEDILEDLVRGKIRSVGEGLSPINFQIHCGMLWFVVTAINIPSLVFWIQNFK